MRRLPVLLLALLAIALCGALIAHASSTAPASFRTPDAAAACRLERQALVCSSLGAASSIALRPHGGAVVVDRLPWWDASTPVLHHWRHGTISCTLAGGAILCRNGKSAAIRFAASGFAVAS
jgi:hypothetical protein